jgi:hypothetical protein
MDTEVVEQDDNHVGLSRAGGLPGSERRGGSRSLEKSAPAQRQNATP